jgi:hypothetical protein
VDTVVAYGSCKDFRDDYQLDTRPDIQVEPKDDDEIGLVEPTYVPVLFWWEFMVSNNSKRKDEDLLKEALELANLDDTKQHRQIFHRWRGEMASKRKAPNELLSEMEETINRYRAAVRKSRIVTGTKYAFAVSGALLRIDGLGITPLAVAGLLAEFGAFVISERLDTEMPEDLKVAAMLHDARKRFGWYR